MAAPVGIASFQGAIQPYVFVVPKASTQQVITAETAYFVFGAQGQVTPWNAPSFMFIRPTTNTTLVSMAANINVPASKWKGTPLGTMAELVNAVSSAKTSEKAIGILGTDVYDQNNRSTLTALAFRAFQQCHAYFPDSTSATRDKQNLRDGHYVLWSPTVYLGRTHASSNLTNPRAKYLVDLLTNKLPTPTPDFDPLATIISVGLIPECAMKVTRSAEGGDLSRYSPATPCGCFFESQVGTAPASCVTCNGTGDVTCNGGKCRFGYCEAR